MALSASLMTQWSVLCMVRGQGVVVVVVGVVVSAALPNSLNETTFLLSLVTVGKVATALLASTTYLPLEGSVVIASLWN